ncbi:2-keto-3-deoxy-L-rhamnonate aldolase [Lachnellula occidentalis]|uniref:2-keto-3-deoxy-L-rhamnonate aldolase n=1 Tax=Lachnellula occidentalis TaxID=215460 RepID=A0A8H8RIN7_9HELO|nr:2-keto-3-deoxy-L-rhamnonate aldolase [Lachnellula occidentalis]
MSTEYSSAIVSASGKTRLRATLERAQKGGAPSVGQWLEFPGFTLSRTVASLGSDWVLVDCEHGNIGDNEMYLAVGAIFAGGASPIVRIPSDEPWMVKRALDAGAHGIMIPMCETPEQAAAIVNAMKYPSKEWPKGIRGAGAMFAPANFSQNGGEYLTTANSNIMVIVQIESRLAVENCEKIAATDGIGPNDLAASMGYFAPDHAKIPEVQEAIARVLKATKEAGKFAGHFALSADTGKSEIEETPRGIFKCERALLIMGLYIAAAKAKQGFHFMNCGADIVAVTAWMSAEMKKFKDLLSGSSNGDAGNITGYH